MAEQDWAAYADQPYVGESDTLLMRTIGGAGVEVPGAKVFAARQDGVWRGNGDAYWTGGFTFDGSGTLGLFIGRAYPNAGLRLRNLALSATASGITYFDFENENSISTGAIAHNQYSDGSSSWSWSATASGARNSQRRGDVLFADWYSVRAGRDNGANLGVPSIRWATIFAAAGTINTSDEREKTWRGAASAAELAAAGAILDELGFYRWNDAIEAKGDSARLHFGVRAQRVWAIMAEHGLVDPIGADGRPGVTPYAFLCFDAWEAEDDAPAGDRFGIRVDQLNSFLIAAQHARQEAQDRRIAAIEARV